MCEREGEGGGRLMGRDDRERTEMGTRSVCMCECVCVGGYIFLDISNM